MDIVERLRRINAFLHITEDEPEYDYKLSYEAADEIERLRGILQQIAALSMKTFLRQKRLMKAQHGLCWRWRSVWLKKH